MHEGRRPKKREQKKKENELYEKMGSRSTERQTSAQTWKTLFERVGSPFPCKYERHVSQRKCVASKQEGVKGRDVICGYLRDAAYIC